jgi:hypothetical protein
VHVRQAELGGATRMRLNQPDVMQLAEIFAVADFHFAGNDRGHFSASMRRIFDYIDLILK